jgi:hypothetical protein
VSQYGWIGVDLDGTLAQYDGWNGIEHVGEPIPAMLTRVKKWVSDGVTVKIFTARVSCAADELEMVEGPIRAWLLEHIGVELPITCRKDYEMIKLWDDRGVQVEPNTGRRLDGR